MSPESDGARYEAAAVSFSADAFFDRASSRVDAEPQRTETEPLGDHHLNPDITADGMSFRDAAVLIPVVARRPQASVA